MRWIGFAIVAFVLVVLQTTLVQLLRVPMGSLGNIVPDLLAAAAVFVCLYCRVRVDAMIAVWVLGLLMDLCTSGGAGSATRVGPMALSYLLAGAVVYGLREAFFRERLFTRALFGAVFCLIAHGLWVTAQCLLSEGSCGWRLYGQMLVKVILVSCAAAVLTPPLCGLLKRLDRAVFIPGPASRYRR